MDYIGIDIGSTASKVVVKGDHDIHFVLPTGWSSKEMLIYLRKNWENRCNEKFKEKEYKEIK